MMQPNAKILGGAFWSLVHRMGIVVISFISNILLARLLIPDDYGAIGMLMIFIALSNTFIDGGFGSALIQKKTPTQEDYSTIFYWNFTLSVLLYAILWITAPWIALFYHMDILSAVLRVQGLVLIINSLSVIQQNVLRKRLLFKKMAIVSVTSALLSMCVALCLAVSGYGVWALVAQQLAFSTFNALLYGVMRVWRPIGVFSLKSFKELFGFGGYILLSNLIITFTNNVQGLIIGRLFTPAVMGLYTQARKLEEVASTTLSTVVDQVSYPVLSDVQDDKEKHVAILRSLSMVSAYVCFPIIILLIVVAEPLITLLYSAKWLACVPYFRILCVAGLVMCIYNLNYFAVASVGQSKVLLKWTIVKRVLGLIFMLLGVKVGGIKGLLWGVVAGYYLIYFINALLSARIVGYALGRQMLDLLPILLLATVLGIGVWRLGCVVDVNAYIVFVIQILVYIFAYILLSIVMRMKVVGMLKDTMRKFIKK